MNYIEKYHKEMDEKITELVKKEIECCPEKDIEAIMRRAMNASKGNVNPCLVYAKICELLKDEKIMFKNISHISDIQDHVKDKKEIRFMPQSNGLTIGCYMFMDSNTFDSPESLECRGIAFDAEGKIVSRPLHKFFNVGEKEWLFIDKIMARDDIAGIYDKIDGSMIATAFVDGKLLWRSKKSFNSDVVKLAEQYLTASEVSHIERFALEIAAMGMTAIFELTHPEARIVVNPKEPQLRLIHIRENVSGKYVLLDPLHEVHKIIADYEIPMVEKFTDLSVTELMESLEAMQDREGYVIQFASGDMVKVKCPWYLRLHRSITFLRERDIAVLALNEELDDVKGALTEAGIDLDQVNAVEARLKGILTGIYQEVEDAYICHQHLDRKDFAIANKGHPYFGMLMCRYQGKEVPINEWYGRNKLKEDFSLRVLGNEALSEAING